MCHQYYGDNDTGKEDPVNITSSILSDLSDAPGVMVEEIHGGIDIGNEATVKTLKYAVPDTPTDRTLISVYFQRPPHLEKLFIILLFLWSLSAWFAAVFGACDRFCL